MMENDLISKSDLMESLNDWIDENTTINDVLRWIAEYETAYNVDKVIHKIHCHYIDRIDDAEQEEIEKLKHDNKVICGIIRNGGKE